MRQNSSFSAPVRKDQKSDLYRSGRPLMMMMMTAAWAAFLLWLLWQLFHSFR
jgi:hypothetical protein